MSNRCVTCNKIIPEGIQVCNFCNHNVTMLEPIVNKPAEELTKGELTAEVIKLNKEIDLMKNKISEAFSDLLKRFGRDV